MPKEGFHDAFEGRKMYRDWAAMNCGRLFVNGWRMYKPDFDSTL